MAGLFRRPPPEHDDEELLHSLLMTPVPPAEEVVRPAALRSIEEQRRFALQSFLQRTWVDFALYRVERLLMLAVFAFFVFWLLNGFVRDWLYEQGYLPQQQPMVSGQPVGAMAAGMPYTATTVDHSSVMLPFTEPATEHRPDYLVPRSVAVPDQPMDRRPFRLMIPPIAVDTPVTEVFIEDGAWQVADYAAGYHHGSAWPGDVGNVVLSGHAGLRGSVFRDLGQLQIGDEIFVDAGEWRYQYEVSRLERVLPVQVEVMQQTSTPVLTLITCTEWDTKRLVVVANLVGSHPL